LDPEFTQGDAIRDYIFPLALRGNSEDAPHFGGLLGSAFLIGNNGFALTAGHVLAELGNGKAMGCFVRNDEWVSFDVLEAEVHPQEDVGIVKLAGRNWSSFMRLCQTWQGQSLRYRSFGYPEDAALELESEGRVAPRPDLVYTEGYIRRRITHQLPGMRGTQLFELSAVAGSGCSGSPVMKISKPVWDVAGIYIGERRNNQGVEVGYAVRAEGFREWVPSILGTTLLAESSIIKL